jgi:peptidoglycan/LPS O-acetylase OafA/YrhL
VAWRETALRLTWLAPLGWLVAAVLFGIWLVAPALRPDPWTFAWGTALCAVAVALGHIAPLRRLHASREGERPGAPSPLPPPARIAGAGTRSRPGSALRPYRGRSHSGGRPRFE